MDVEHQSNIAKGTISSQMQGESQTEAVVVQLSRQKDGAVAESDRKGEEEGKGSAGGSVKSKTNAIR